MDKAKYEQIKKEAEKEVAYLLGCLGSRNHCIVLADLKNFRIAEVDEKSREITDGLKP
jgi:hypothetical protein